MGGADTIHGEAGDDEIYGMAGKDVIFGEAQDDNIYGGAGNDWMSAGTGDDGMLGDDGRIMTSRNGIAEPLYGVVASTQRTLNTGGGAKATAIANPTARLHKAVILTPFGQGGDDIMYGGLGNDFMHAGMGADAMSGAEAMPAFYSAPASTPPVVFDLGYWKVCPL